VPITPTPPHCNALCNPNPNPGADEALMLDPHGQVATCNSTHFFIVRDGEVWTSNGNYCIPGITRWVLPYVIDYNVITS
jgi:branched-chain amino acid aminotransferase